MLLSKSLLHSPLLFHRLSFSNNHSHFYTTFFFYSQPAALFSVEKSLPNCVKAGHQHTHSLVQSRDNGPPAVSSMSPGLSVPSDHSAATAPTASDTISHYHPSADSTGSRGALRARGVKTASAPQLKGFRTAAKGWDRQKMADVPQQDTQR